MDDLRTPYRGKSVMLGGPSDGAHNAGSPEEIEAPIQVKTRDANLTLKQKNKNAGSTPFDEYVPHGTGDDDDDYSSEEQMDSDIRRTLGLMPQQQKLE